MLRKIRKLIPHSVVNYGKHLPEAVVANFKQGFPSKKLKVIGVTGTDGKTTTVNMIYQVLKDAGKRVSMISTINATIAGKSFDTGFHVTSPEAADIQKYLNMAKDYGDEFMVLEVSSHALDQFRVWGVDFEVGVITNITPEHLDYHKTFANYLKAKAKLIQSATWAILKYEDQNYNHLKKLARGQVISFGLTSKANLTPKTFPLKLKMPGNYNLLNALAATAIGRIYKIPDQQIRKSLENFAGLEGRMETVPNKRGLNIVIDFASTPYSLENALITLRAQTKGKLIAVFGSASERDIQKRPAMGKISSELADITILTDEDPRFESSMQIINEIAAGMDQKAIVHKEPDRATAIKLGISLAQQGDTIGIFGKGHEKSMNYRGEELPWSDKKAVQKALHGE